MTNSPPASHAIGRIAQVRTGRARPFTRPGSRSAIAKQAVAGPVHAGPLGLAGDEVGDARVHGGADKAVHAYALSHYPFWQAQWPGHPGFQPGAFGENLCVQGMGQNNLDEQNICLGDVWQIGQAELQVSQGRQPCWKLNDRFAIADMARQVQDSLRAGWYLRVLKPGQVQAGDAIALLARPHPDWPIARLLALIRDRVCAPDQLRAALALPLPHSWQRLFARRLAQQQAEDWTPRLQGPATTQV